MTSASAFGDDDVFMRSRPDPRLVELLDRNMWFDTLAYLPVRDIVPNVPNVNKFFNREVVWHEWSGRLLWLEMAPGAIDAQMLTAYWDDNPPSQTALIRACEIGTPVAHVSALLAGGANVNAVDRCGWTALNRASCRGYEGIVRALLGSNADPNIANNSNGCTPLISASAYDHSSMVSLLIESGANINHASTSDWTALMVACGNNQVDCVRLLVNARADITMRNSEDQTALDIARHEGNDDIVRILEEASI